MPKVISIIEKRNRYKLRVSCRIGGALKERFLKDLEKGYKEGEIVRSAIDEYYKNRL